MPKGKLPKLFSGTKNRPEVIFGEPVSFKEMVKNGTITENADDSRVANALKDIIENLR